MARFENLNINKLKVKKITNTETGKYFIPYAATIAGENASTTLNEASRGLVSATDLAFLTYGVNGTPGYVATALFDEIGNITGTTSANMATTDRINVMAVRKGIPGYGVVFAGTHSSSASESTHAITLTGLLATDLAFGQMRALESNSRILNKLVCTADTLTATFSGSTAAAAHSFDYVVVRPLGSFTQSHEIILAGTLSIAGGAAYEAESVAGLASTDVVLATTRTQTTGGKYIKTVLPAAGTLTVTWDADPGASTVDYVVFRAVDQNG